MTAIQRDGSNWRSSPRRANILFLVYIIFFVNYFADAILYELKQLGGCWLWFHDYVAFAHFWSLNPFSIASDILQETVFV